MKIKKALVMNLEIDATDRGVNVGVEVGLEPCIANILNDDETKKISDVMTEVSSIMNDALIRDLEESTSLSLRKSRKEDIEKLKEDLSKMSDPDEKLERLVKELVNNILSI